VRIVADDVPPRDPTVVEWLLERELAERRARVDATAGVVTSRRFT
jgi:hypothetical protein